MVVDGVFSQMRLSATASATVCSRQLLLGAAAPPLWLDPEACSELPGSTELVHSLRRRVQFPLL